MARLIILRLLDSYFRHRWLNLLPIVLMIGLASASFTLAEPEYVSRGRLYVQKAALLPSLTQLPSEGYTWRTPTQVALSELQELVQTEAFVRSVIQKTDLEANMSGGSTAVQRTIEYFRLALSLQQVGDSVIEIAVTDKTPKHAQQLAAATIDAYTIWKLNGDQQESAVAQSFFRDVLPGYQDNLQKARGALKTYLEAHPVPLRGERPAQEQLEISQLQSAVDVATRRVENALEKEESARLAQAQAQSNVRQDYLLIDAPTLPIIPETSLRQRLMGPLIFVIVGIILTIVCIVGGALLDRSFRFPLDVQTSLGLPVLALVPDVSRIVQPPVVTEPITAINSHEKGIGFETTALPQLSNKQRRARQLPPAVAAPSTRNTDISDATPILSDQTTA
jgi:capsular polysaccharide biosynthesis protein